MDRGSEDPVDTASLGRATWTFLHTLAAAYPIKADASERSRMQSFMNLFGSLYPCDPCAAGFREIMKDMPPEVGSHAEFSQWMCKAHNAVNLELGKPQFDCAKVDQRWGVCEECQSHESELKAFKKLMSAKRF